MTKHTIASMMATPATAPKVAILASAMFLQIL
jgi:hypothetical protein